MIVRAYEPATTHIHAERVRMHVANKVTSVSKYSKLGILLLFLIGQTKLCGAVNQLLSEQCFKLRLKDLFIRYKCVFRGLDNITPFDSK
jgi:hypothetical protein